MQMSGGRDSLVTDAHSIRRMTLLFAAMFWLAAMEHPGPFQSTSIATETSRQIFRRSPFVTW